MVCARAVSRASQSRLRSQVSQQLSHGLLVLEVAVSPLSLVLSFPIVVGGGMVLQAVEVSQIIKRSKFFHTCDQLNLLCSSM